MATTIQVHETTRQQLGRLRAELGASSYDEVIRRLLSQVKQGPDSLFGTRADAKPFTRKDRTRFHDL